MKLYSTIFAFGLLAATSAAAVPLDLREIRNTTTTSTGSLVGDGLYDAFDGAFRLYGGSLGNALPGGLGIQRDIATLEDSYTYRVLDIFTNTTNSTLNVDVLNYTNLGSDGREHVVEEGTNQTTSFQDRNRNGSVADENGDPVLTFLYGNNAFSAANIVGDISANRFDMNIDLSLGAGESIGILYFATLIRDDTDRSNDVATAQGFAAGFAADPFTNTGLTQQQIATVANFGPGVSEVPLPAGLPLLLSGFAAMGLMKRKRRS